MTNTEATTDTRTAAVAEHGAHVAPEKAAAKRAASRKKGEPNANKRAKQTATKKAAKPAASKRAAKRPVPPTSKKASPAPTEARDGSKKATILELLRRPKGATLTEIAEATNWQNHYADVRIIDRKST